MDLVKRGIWKDSLGILHNPRKSFFLRLAARRVLEVTNKRHADRLTFAGKDDNHSSCIEY